MLLLMVLVLQLVAVFANFPLNTVGLNMPAVQQLITQAWSGVTLIIWDCQSFRLEMNQYGGTVQIKLHQSASSVSRARTRPQWAAQRARRAVSTPCPPPALTNWRTVRARRGILGQSRQDAQLVHPTRG